MNYRSLEKQEKLNTSLCNWLLDFLTGRPQAVRVGINTSCTITLNTGAPQGCVLSPLLFTLLTYDCTPSHNSNLFIKFADDTTVVGLISIRTSTAPVSPAKPSALQVIPPTRHTASSVCCHQGGDCGVSRRGPADWRTASYIRLSGSWTPARPWPPLFYPTQHWTLTLRPPPPPSSPHPQDLPPPPPPPTPTYKLWPAPATLCSTGLISTSSSIDCKLPLLTVW